MEPFALALAFDSGRLEPHTSRIERRASAMQGAYADAAALRELVEAGDPVVYEVEQRDLPEEVGQLICCTTIINPGTVGDEYFMTKGHYHAVRDTAEIYLGLSGHGTLLLQTEGGETAVLPIERGTVAYVPPGWAHRTVNVGGEPLVFFAVYPGQAGHDYGAIEASGFARRVLKTASGPIVVPVGRAGAAVTEPVVAVEAQSPALRPLADCVVVVTPRSFGEYDKGLQHELEEAVAEVRYRPGPLAAGRLADVVADADGLLAGLDEINAEVFERAPRLRVVARYGVGADRIDLDAAARHGVTVTVTPGANANAVAELTIALLLALARQLVTGRDRVRAGEWPAMRGVEVAGRTIGLLGLGRIGSLVAAKARALGLRVLAYDPFVAREQGEAAGSRLVDLETLAAESDFLSLHAQLTEESRGIVDRALLARLKAGAALVNTARAELVDEQALLWALDHGPLRAAALDVLAEEPPPPDHPLLRRRDVLVTPHIGAHTAEAATAMGRIALDELLAVLSGRAPRFPAVPATRVPA